MADQVIGLTVKAVGDFSDVVSNVGNLQKALTKLKLPDKLGDSLGKNISNFYKEYEKYQKRLSEGINTQGDKNAVNKSLNSMLNSYEKIINDFNKLSGKDFKEIFNLDEGEFASIQKKLREVEAQMKKIKLDPKQFQESFNQISKLTKAESLFGKDKGLNKMQIAFNENDLNKAKEALAEIEKYYNRFSSKMAEPKRSAMADEIKKLKTEIDTADKATEQFQAETQELNQAFNNLGSRASKEVQDTAVALNKTKDAAGEVTKALKEQHEQEYNFKNQVTQIDRQIQSYFGLSQMIRKVGQIARDAFQTVKELDAAMTETAVVTNFSVGDMWDMLPTYTAQANQLGSTIKDVYEAATLYYQQGLNTNQAMGLANETLKMARIAGLDAAEATDMMTAALRGFNMEINQMSAQKINDIYSELAAITASDTAEIGSAMERTASIAHSANMDFATTSAFLAQMIETTREAPENLGTAMKTIVARFQEMKKDPTKLVDAEGVAMDVNKVDTALKSIGVALTNTKGEFRDLDDVFLDISSKWDSLTQGQQRYIATIAAGSRQQSRFIAMMSNYDRTMELVDAANNSAGASQRQFEKTLDSMEAKLNKLKNAWDQFAMGLMNNQILKTGVDLLTDLFTIVNKIIGVFGKIPDPFGGLIKSAATLGMTLGALNLGKKGARGLIGGVVGWYEGQGFIDNFRSGFNPTKKERANKYDTINTGKYTKDAQEIVSTYEAKIRNSKIDTLLRQKFQQGAVLARQEIIRIMQTTEDANQAANFIDTLSISEEAKRDAIYFCAEMESSIKDNKISVPEAAIQLENDLKGVDLSEIVDSSEGVNLPDVSPKISGAEKTLTKFGNSVSKTGIQLQVLGNALMDTPFQPFGMMISKAGSLLVNFGDLAISVGKKVSKGLDAVNKMDPAAGGSKIMTFLNGAAPGLSRVLGLLGSMPIPLKIILGILAVVAAIILKIKHEQKEALENAENNAAAAADAFDSAKQETSELNDSLEQIKSNEDAFENLVAGTAEFNEQLVNANERITELLQKYPELYDYVTTDKNGLMHVSQEGLDFVKDLQKLRQNRASALNIVQTADLRAVENQQKAAQLRKPGAMTMTQFEQNKAEADLLEARAKAETEMARQNAVRTVLSNQELGNAEKTASILAEQYETRKKMVNLSGKSDSDLKQMYADYYGYTYNKSTKKMTDIEGNEISTEDIDFKDAITEITVLGQFEMDADSVDSSLRSIDNAFDKTIEGNFEGSSTFISDVLSRDINANEDLLKEITKNPEKLNTLVDSLSEKEIAAVLGVTEEEVAGNLDKYKDDFTDKVLSGANDILDTQAQSYGELGAMLAQVSSDSTDEFIYQASGAVTLRQKANIGVIREQLDALTAEQKQVMLKAGRDLMENAGVDSMKAYISFMVDDSNIDEVKNEVNEIFKGADLSTALGRLDTYTQLTNSETKAVKELGNSLLKSTDSANLLGDAFAEMYTSQDFTELTENMDKFVDSSGNLNAASIRDMAEESVSLNRLLDTGAISAGGMAMALNALGHDGNMTLSDLNSHVLELLSSFAQLDTVMSNAHYTVENFDPGIDTGEGEDFIKEQAKNFKELYDNGEYGNPQLEAIAKLVVGEEEWIEKLKDNNGNLEETLNELAPRIEKFSDGFYDSWAALANANTELNGIAVNWNNDGSVHLDVGESTTEEVIDFLMKTRNISKEAAELMLTDFENYSGDLKTELQKNDFEAGLENGNYIKDRTTANGNIAITQSELDTISSSTGKSVDEIKSAIEDKSGIPVTVLENKNEDGSLRTDYKKLNQELSSAEGYQYENSWVAEYVKKDLDGQEILNKNNQKIIDVGNAIQGAVDRGYDQTQAQGMVYESFLNAAAQDKEYQYKGETIDPREIKSLDDFVAKIAEIDQNEQWTKVGQAIADGYLDRIEARENGTEESESSNTKKDNESAEQNNEATRPPRGGNSGSGSEIETPISYEEARNMSLEPIKNIFSGLYAGIKDGISGEGAVELSTAQMNAQDAARAAIGGLFTGLLDGIESGQPTEDPKTAAGEASREGWENTWTSVTEAFSTGAEFQAEAQKTAAENSATAWQDLWNGIKKTFSKTPAVDPDPKTNGSLGKGKESGGNTITTETQGTVNVTYTGEIANSEQLKASLQTKLATILKQISSQNQTIKAKATLDVKNKVKNQTATVDYTKGKQAKADKQTTTVDYKLGTQASPKPKTTTVNYTLGSQANPVAKTVDISPHFIGNWEKKITLSVAKGMNNNFSYPSVPQAGSLAKGTRSRYGQVGPRGKGGLTLTGELGYEIAWLPDENRSMILGAGGPQMINLPNNAVVFDHKQSEEIMKRKAIPASSMASGYDKRGGSGNSGGGGGGNPKKDNKKTRDTITKATTAVKKATNSISVWWDNISRMVDSVRRQSDKDSENLEKLLNQLGGTMNKSITTLADKYKKDLQKVIDYNGKIVSMYKSDLGKLDGGKVNTSISYKSGKKTRNETINLANYVKRDKNTGAYVIESDKIHNMSKERGQAIVDAANKYINDKVSRMNSAQDAIDKARKEMDDLANKVYETFYNWKKEVNEIYVISKKLEDLQSARSRYSAQVDLEIAKLTAGFGTYGTALQNIIKSLNRDNEALTKQLEYRQNDIVAKKKALDEALSVVDDFKTYNAATTHGANGTAAQGDYKIAQIVANLVKSSRLNADGTYDLNTAYTTLNNANYNKETYDKIKEKLDAIYQAQQDYQSAIESGTNDIKAIYDKIEEYQETLASAEETLLSGLEEETEAQIDRLDKLDKSLTDALKDLLDEVKKKLDERRKQEDNAKTEQDISQKQQRLAMLRADTAGGNAVEIAKLEKEIADSRQNYERSLEDQLIDRMQDQADKAAKQRERQISLLEAQLDVEKSSNSYVATVDEWIKNPQKYYEQIREAWRKSNDYDEQGEFRQKQLDEEFNAWFANLGTAISQIQPLSKDLDELGVSVEKLVTILNAQSSKASKNLDSKVTALNTGITTERSAQIRDMLKSGATAAQVQKATGATYKELQEAVNMEKGANGITQKSMAGAAVKSVTPDGKHTVVGHLNTKGDTLGAAVGRTMYTADWDPILGQRSSAYRTADITTWTMNMLAGHPEEVKDGLLYAMHYFKPGSKINPNMVSFIKQLGLAGQQIKNTKVGSSGGTYGTVGDDGIFYYDWGGNVVKWNMATGKLTTEKFDLNTFKKKAALNKAYSTEYRQALRTKHIPGYATGGLADYTGPAWLDGTKSKPEIVLNAQDTKNFIALRDILSRSMSSISTIQGGYVEGAGSTFEININVDTLTSDYDVDKVVERVKKIIVKDANYRNVTSVRKFR